MDNLVGRPSRRNDKLRAVDEFLVRHLLAGPAADVVSPDVVMPGVATR